MQQKRGASRRFVDEQRPSRTIDDEESKHQEKPVAEDLQEGVEEVLEGARQEVQAERVPWFRTIKRGQMLLVFYGVLVAMFAALAWWVHYHPVLAIDVTITRVFQEDQSPWLRDVMIAVSYLGYSLPLSLGLLFLTAAIFWLMRLRLEALMLIGISVSSSLLNGLLKVIVARPRPTAHLVGVVQAAAGQSFPSGHVMSYVAFWGFLFSLGMILFKGKRWWRVALLIVPALFVILVGPSRIYLGDHWASDVLGAYLIEGVWLGLFLLLYLRLKEKGVLASRKK